MGSLSGTLDQEDTPHIQGLADESCLLGAAVTVTVL